MKIISLNTWGGRAGKENLLAFFKTHTDTDIFCLQEIWSAPYEHLEGRSAGGKSIDHREVMVYGLQEISKILPNHTAYFRPNHLNNYGLLTLVNKTRTVVDEGESYVHKYKDYEIPEGEDVGLHARSVQYITVKKGENNLTVLNFHGLWNGKGKGDSEDRIVQSQRIISMVKEIPNEIVFCGDFNLLPETRSLKMLEEFGLSNLISRYGITSTRTSLYTKPDTFADYIFVTKGISVKECRVLPDEVSDHAPLLIEID